MKNTLRRINWFLREQLGIDAAKFLRFWKNIARYVSDREEFRRQYTGHMEWVPCVHDWDAQAGSIQSEYFVQDLIVARRIHTHSPIRHVDIGSRLDGFVAHVAAYREIEVLDIRPLSNGLPGIKFRQADLTRTDSDLIEYTDSLSCLHALEHFGLGRYGDTVDARGFSKGFANLCRLLKPGGTLYLSLPIGRERVEFNANRVVALHTVLQLADEFGVELIELLTISATGVVSEHSLNSCNFELLSAQRYNLGIFFFKKTGPESVDA